MKLETNNTFTRPGAVLLATGVGALLLRLAIGGLPLIGGLLSIVLLLGGIFFIVGGAFLLIKPNR